MLLEYQLLAFFLPLSFHSLKLAQNLTQFYFEDEDDVDEEEEEARREKDFFGKENFNLFCLHRWR